jgi:hypothetical protein
MKTEKLVVAVAATAVAFGIGVAPPASAAGNVQTVGIEELLRDPNGTEVAYTVTKIVPSGAPVAYPVGGRLYEATVMARALRGTVNPVVPFFNARAASGANYPALAQVSTLSAGPLFEGTTTTGTVYFDVVGDLPNSVVYDNGPEDLLTWVQAGEAMPGGASGGGSTGEGGGGSQGVNGSTGPNNVSPPTSGGESGNTGEGGTEGGGGNLDSGGGAGAPNGDTGD